MANQQHIDWLLEGVAAWNERRKRGDFKPNFSNTDLQKALKKANMVAAARRADLREADLEGAKFGGQI